MSILDNASYKTAGSTVRVNGTDLPGLQSISGLAGGSAPEQTASTFASAAQEYVLGLADGGTLTCSGLAVPQHPIIATLIEAKDDGNKVSVVAAIGGRDADTNRYTTGGGITVASGRTMAPSGTGGSNDKVKFTDTDDAGLPGVQLGDYLSYYTGSGQGTLQNSKITAREVTAGSAVFTLGDLTAAVVLSTNNNLVSVTRPGVKWAATALVSDFNYTANTDGLYEFNLSLRVTGKTVQTVGTPSVTL